MSSSPCHESTRFTDGEVPHWIDGLFDIISHFIFLIYIATTVLEEAMRISQQLKMEKEIDGIQDRNVTIQNLTRNGLDWFNERRPQNPPTSLDPREVNTDDLEDLLQSMFSQEIE